MRSILDAGIRTYIDDKILIPENDVVYDKNEDPLQVASGVTPSDRAERSSKNSIRKSEPKVNTQFSDRASDRYVTDDSIAQNSTEEVQFSLRNDSKFMDAAEQSNERIGRIANPVMVRARNVREKIAQRMNELKMDERIALPEDIEGNTYIANSSYDGTEENTTICPRSLAAEAFVDAVSEMHGRPLTVAEQIHISQDLQGRTLTPECLYCYVATDRKAYRAYLGEYVKQRDAVIQAYQDGDTDVFREGKLYQTFLDGRKDTPNMWKRFNMWINAVKNGKPTVQASHLANINKLMGDIQSEFGAELKAQIKDAMAYAQSASWAKKRISYVAYNGHILKWKQERINKLNSHYGLRMYSFSDFSPAFILENMQMITDAAVRGLKMLGYTKEIDFVKIFAKTGMNINVSTFGFESGGKVYENNIIGANWEQAKALREQYPNVGITFVATNDTLVNWALDQDWIDVVIPYHLVRTGTEVAKALNYTNYTSESSDTKDNGWQKGVDQKYIAPTEHNNDFDTYMAALKKNHLKPRFERFINHPSYMKLVNETRQSAANSKPVQPVFDLEAANESMAKLATDGYYQPIGGTVDRMYEIAAEVAEDLGALHSDRDLETEVQYSYRGTNKDGIEVYETSDEIKKLSYKERQQRFLDIMANEYRGRTAKFIRNGHAYYATFDEKDINKNIYGDKRSDQKGWKAKINVGADGNIFELVENAQYDGSKQEKGKKITAHRGVGYWDYFIKNVQIDGTVYDLLANVRKKADGAFVYSIQLNENKKIKASPPLGSLLRASSGVPNASGVNVAQIAPVVNPHSDRDPESVSNRALLAKAFENAALSQDEELAIQKYKQVIPILEQEEQKLRQLNEQIRELSFAKGPRDKNKLRELRDEATKTANRISVYDGKLLRMEASKPLQAIVEREKKKAYQRAKQKSDEAMAAHRERSNRTVMRHKIHKVVHELDSLLRRDDKKHHVPDSLKKAVASALDMVQMTSYEAEEKIAKYEALIAGTTDADLIKAYEDEIIRIRDRAEAVSNRLKELHEGYAAIANSDDPDIAAGYLDAYRKRENIAIDLTQEFPENDIISEAPEGAEMNSLEDTFAMMTSSDYKERFKAEHRQLQIRMDKLTTMLSAWKSGKLKFTPPCSYDLLAAQLNAMSIYAHFLQERADIEGIEL